MGGDGGRNQQSYSAVNSVSTIATGMADEMDGWCNSAVNVMGATNHFLIGFKASSTELLYGTVN